ncbi:MAG: heme ABC exporter ATP-binding protein CcmA [Candidatus Krumholzibacteriia bacterium]
MSSDNAAAVSGGEAILRTRDLSKRFGSLTALHSASLQLDRGECLAVFGRNGAGKTTLLRIVATLIRSYTGGVYLFGQELNAAGDDIRRRLGFVSHESFLYEDLPVTDNLTFYARLYGLDRAEERVRRTIRDMGLEAKAAVPVRALSRGMKQRLSLGRAFLHEPELLLFDEPFTGLDERAADLLDGRIAEFKRGGGSLMMATHNAERGWRHADRAVVLDRGSVVYEAVVADTPFDAFRAAYRDILSS